MPAAGLSRRGNPERLQTSLTASWEARPPSAEPHRVNGGALPPWRRRPHLLRMTLWAWGDVVLLLKRFLIRCEVPEMANRFICFSEAVLKGFDSRLDSEVREEALCFRGISIHGVGPVRVA